MAGLQARKNITWDDVQHLVMSTGHSLQAAITADGFINMTLFTVMLICLITQKTRTKNK